MSEFNHNGLVVSTFDDELAIEVIRSDCGERISYVGVVYRPEDDEDDVRFSVAIRNRFGEEFYVDGDDESFNIWSESLIAEDDSISMTDDELVLIATLRAKVAALID